MRLIDTELVGSEFLRVAEVEKHGYKYNTTFLLLKAKAVKADLVEFTRDGVANLYETNWADMCVEINPIYQEWFKGSVKGTAA